MAATRNIPSNCNKATQGVARVGSHPTYPCPPSHTLTWHHYNASLFQQVTAVQPVTWLANGSSCLVRSIRQCDPVAPQHSKAQHSTQGVGGSILNSHTAAPDAMSTAESTDTISTARCTRVHTLPLSWLLPSSKVLRTTAAKASHNPTSSMHSPRECIQCPLCSIACHTLQLVEPINQ